MFILISAIVFQSSTNRLCSWNVVEHTQKNISPHALIPHQITITKLQFLDILEKECGIGTFGKVFLAADGKREVTVALKIVRSINKYIDSAKIEAEVFHQKALNLPVTFDNFRNFLFISL